MKPRIPSTLVIGYGNPSRGDDALAPLLLDALRERAAWNMDEVELLIDFQLQVEHVLDLEGRRQVVFVDAAQCGPAPFRFDLIQASAFPAPATHALSPQALLAVYLSHYGVDAPPSRVLAIRGYSFGLGQELSAGARQNLEAALALLVPWLSQSDADRPRVCGASTALPAGD